MEMGGDWEKFLVGFWWGLPREEVDSSAVIDFMESILEVRRIRAVGCFERHLLGVGVRAVVDKNDGWVVFERSNSATRYISTTIPNLLMKSPPPSGRLSSIPRSIPCVREKTYSTAIRY